MKSLDTYINEALKLGKKRYYAFPKTKEELVRIIDKTITEKGFNCDLNFIDTSKITDMTRLFDASDNGCCTKEYDTKNHLYEFTGDISEWDTSNVESMAYMFQFSKFNGDISKWKVNKVYDMYAMFRDSEFARKGNNSTAHWKINPKCDIDEMFLTNY